MRGTRQELVALFRQELGKLPGIGFQKVLPGNRSSYKDFSLTVDAKQFGLYRATNWLWRWPQRISIRESTTIRRSTGKPRIGNLHQRTID